MIQNEADSTNISRQLIFRTRETIHRWKLHLSHLVFPWRFILLGLLLLHIAHQSYARNMKPFYDHIKMHDDEDGHDEKHVDGHASSHMDMDYLLFVFFKPTDLKAGKTMEIYFPFTDPSAAPKILPKEEADSIPFSLRHLPYLLSLFSLLKHSPQGKAVEYTLKQCDLESIKGETKFCATSLESMLEFSQKMLGYKTQMKVLTTIRLSNSTTLVQNYTVVGKPKEIMAPKLVACHEMPYPYAVFYCHSQQSNNRVLEVSLEAEENGDRVQAAAICHMDTSQWDKDHASFRVLKTQPGASPVCHFVSTDSFVWLPEL